ncbi:hypothetical protein NQ315_007368 [Exocentrus adspersus]|uniref:Cytochrome P450 n=1 Tax=Exocentrus adspersus TaxID=1586481 RepID=A0AAV8VH40_9CUCU|nr:hypothetical protein NQ315_007368 [Exocentrus adspersus]
MAILTGWTDSFLTDLTAVLATVTAIIYAYFKWTYQYWKRRGLPYFEPSIPFGNMPNPVTSRISLAENVRRLYEHAKSKGQERMNYHRYKQDGWRHCGSYTLTNSTWFVLDLDLIKHVLTKDFQYFTDREIFVNEKDDPLSTHLFALGGTRWRNLRAKLSPTFTSGKMKMMFQTMVECGQVLEKYIDEELTGKQVVDIKEILGRFSTDIIGSCAFGLECNSFQEPNSPFRVYGKKTLTPSTMDILKRFVSTCFPSFAKAIVAHRVEEQEKEKLQVLLVPSSGIIVLVSNTSLFLGNGNNLTMGEIVAQSFIFFIAGFETSSTTMTFALFELATRPDIQDKMREEIRTVLAKHDDKINYDSMNELVYMKRVIDETLRKHSPVALLSRKAVADYKVPGEDLVIEKGTGVFIPVTGLHYDEDYYEQPELFNPDRFSPENKSARNPYCHLPFGEGPRICIGERFGILQTKVGLTSVLKNHRITLNKKTTVPLVLDPKAVVTSAVGGIWLDIDRL